MLIKNRYELRNQIGSGGFGDTYLGIDTDKPSKSKIVIKRLSFGGGNASANELKIVKERFEIEARILEKLAKNNECIPDLFAFIEENNQFYLIQDFIDGVDLSRLKNHETWNENQVRWFLSEALKILDYIHREGVIHRDIKPSNFMFVAPKNPENIADSKLFLIDFGAVKQVVADGDDQKQSTIMIGTSGYMAPEQQAGDPQFSSDIFGLGITAICMLTGKDPNQFEYDANGVDVDKILPFVSTKLRNVIKGCIVPNYTQRYQNAQEVLQEIIGITNNDADFKQALNRTIMSTEYVNLEKGNGQSSRNTYQDQKGRQSFNDNVPQTVVAQQDVTKMKGTHKAGLLLVAIIFAGVLGYVGLTNNNSSTPVIAENNTEEQSNSESSSSNDDSISSNTNQGDTQSNESSERLFRSSSNFSSYIDNSKLISFSVPDNWAVYGSDWVKNERKIGVKLFATSDTTEEQEAFKDYRASSFFVGLTKNSLNFANLKSECKNFSFINRQRLFGKYDVNTKVSDQCGSSGKGKFVESIGTYKNPDGENVYFTVQTQSIDEEDRGVIGKIFETMEFPRKVQ